MKRKRCALLALCLAMSALAPAAFADMGPKPEITIYVEEWPAEAEGFYLDLLVQDEQRHYALENDGTYAGLMLDALRELEADGWHAARTGGTSRPLSGDVRGKIQEDGSRVFSFGYLPPDDFRVVAVWPDGTLHMSAETYHRTRFSETVRLDLSTMRLEAVYGAPWRALARQFCQTFFPTLLAEGLLLAVFGFGRIRRNWLTLTWVNLVTQAALTLALSCTVTFFGTASALLFALPAAEAVIVVTESLLYRRFLRGGTAKRRVVYAVAANAASLAAGLALQALSFH